MATRRPTTTKVKRVRRRKPVASTKAKATSKGAQRAPKVGAVSVPPAPPTQPRGNLDYLEAMAAEIGRMRRRQERSATSALNPFQIPQHPPRATPPKDLQMAMDNGLEWANASWVNGTVISGIPGEGQVFLGYPFLAELAQRPEYRVISETIADDATRKWIDFDVTGTEANQDGDDAQADEPDETPDAAQLDKAAAKGVLTADRRMGFDFQPPNPDPNNPIGVIDDPQAKAKADAKRIQEESNPRVRRDKRIKDAGKTERIKQLKDEMTRLGVRDRFYALARDDGFFGRSHLFLNFGQDLDGANDAELKTDIGDGRDETSRGKVAIGSLKSIKVIEATWAYPTTYNAINPLADDWYNPQVWYVMGKEIHVSRFLPFIGHPVPDLLKPSYSFGGLSLSQMARPYVDIWLTTRQSVAQMIHAFSVMVLSMDMQTNVQPSGGSVPAVLRGAMFNQLRDNMGLFILNKDTEDFKNVSAPMGGLDHLQAQAQEHMASVSRIPLVKLTGISPSGLNASSEGEIRAYYDTIAAFQNRFFRENLTRVINFIQLSLWGEIDPEITFDFEPLWEITDKEKGDLQKADAERHNTYVDMGVISPAEVRRVVINDPQLPYTGLDPDDVPDLKEEEQQGLAVPDAGQGEKAVLEQGGAGTPEPKPEPEPEAKPTDDDAAAADDQALDLDPLFAIDGAADAEGDWDEHLHPRSKDGKFGSGGGSSGSSSKASPPKTPQKLQAPQYGVGATSAHHQHEAAAKPSGGLLKSLYGMLSGGGSPGGSSSPKPGSSSSKGPLDPSKLERVGEAMGSNPGGVFKDEEGRQFYVKKLKSPQHVKNELTAANLYKLTGTPILDYKPVVGGNHVATRMRKLDKDRAYKLSPKELASARKDFVAHAWLSNWDAVGTGGDNLGTVKGVPTALDLGGALTFRAQGSPKGAAFGNTVGELETMRSPKMSPDAAKVFGPISDNELIASARRVTDISDEAISKAVADGGMDQGVANILIARRNDIAQRMAKLEGSNKPQAPTSVVNFTQDSIPVSELNGIPIKSWHPPDDWADVSGQTELDEPPFEIPEGKKGSSGVIIREPDGRTWLMKPKGAYGGYEFTFPKGRIERNLSMQANAIKEAYEETGLKARIVGYAGDYEGDTTFTRYYVAEREGGTPADAGHEASGVSLVPPERMTAFLNRDRDIKIASAHAGGAHDEAIAQDDAAAEWNEQDHPRAPDGKFGSGSSSSSSSKKEEGEIKFPKAGAPKEHWDALPQYKNYQYATSMSDMASKFDATMGSPAKKSTTYRWQLKMMIAQAKAFSLPDMVPKLQLKMAESWNKERLGALAVGNEKDASKIASKMEKLGWKFDKEVESGTPVTKATPAAAAKPAPVAPAPTPPAKSEPYQSFKNEESGLQSDIVLDPKTGKYDVHLKDTDANETVSIIKGNTLHDAVTKAQDFVDSKNYSDAVSKVKKETVPLPPPPPMSSATPQELEKAKKSIKLQLQYVPGAPGTPEAQKLVDAFNKKYEGVPMNSEAQLKQKVADFKGITAAMIPLKAAQQKAQLQKQAQAQYAAAEAAAKEAQKFAEKYGASPETKAQYETLMAIGGDAKYFLHDAQNRINSAGLADTGITPTEAAMIIAYSGSHYVEVNKQLRAGMMTKEQFKFAKALNTALDRLPVHNGTTYRKATLPADVAAKYKPGYVVTESGFTSSSKKKGTWAGSYQYIIEGKGGRDISKLSSHSGEAEVLFKSNSAFIVKKVDGNNIHLEEID